tara:strand:- start:37 stop:453 length:417 start_codon:yes stop_codon:yes gene_type:complete
MSFLQAIESGFSNYVNFKGRASRSEYLWWLLFATLINLIPFVALVTFLPSISLIARRLHDINKSGWNYFWCFTIIGIIPVLYWLCFKAGDEGDNFYGTNPLKSNIDFDNISKLEKLAELKDKGHITEEEYIDKKKQLL